MGKRNIYIQQDIEETVSFSFPWEELHGLNIFITGASGFIGGAIVETLAYLNETTNKVPIKIYAHARNAEKLKQKFSHLVDTDYFISIIGDICLPCPHIDKIDLIIHAASEASPIRYLSNPVDTIKSNTIGTINLLELAKTHKAKFLFLSSGVVYGDSTQDELYETVYGSLDPLHPRSCYSESKRLAETLCMAYWRQFGIPVTIARISHTYGPGLSIDDGRVFTAFIKHCINNEDICLDSDGLSSRPFCYITDMIFGLFLIAFKGKPGNAYNIGATHELKIIELAHLIKKISGKNNLKIHCSVNHSNEIRSSGHFNLDKITQLGWQPSINPEIGFSRLYKFFTNQASID